MIEVTTPNSLLIKESRCFELAKKTNYIAVNNSGSIIAIPNKTEIIIWHIEKKIESKTLSAHTDNINSILFTEDSKYIISASSDKTIKIWDIFDCEKPVLVLHEHTSSVEEIILIENDTKIISYGDDGKIILWDIKTGQKIKLISEKIDQIRFINYINTNKFILFAKNSEIKLLKKKMT